MNNALSIGKTAWLRHSQGPAWITAVLVWACSWSLYGQNSLTPGVLDTSFSPQADNSVYALAIQTGNKILIGGKFTRINNTERQCLARLNPDGSIDTGFFYLSGADNSVRALLVLSDGRIVAGGDFTAVNGMNWSRIARLNADGSVDSSFDQLIGANGRVNALAQSGDKLYVGGAFTKVNDVTRNYVARLNANGSLDTTFNASFNGSVYVLAVVADNKLLVGGEFTSAFNQPVKYLARLNADGSLDSSFNVNVDLSVYAFAMQSNGKIILGGFFGRAGGVSHSGLARLNADGTLDSLFTAGTSGTVYSLAVQADDKIIVGGRFTSLNNANRKEIARLNANGLLDVTFDPGEGPNYAVNALALQSDGNVVIGGEFSTVSALDHNYVARLVGNPPPPIGQDITIDIWHAVEITWPSELNAQYQVQWATEADATVWNNLGAPVVGNGSLMSVFDSTRNNNHKYFKVKKL